MPFAQARYKDWCELQQKVIQLQKEHEEEEEQLQHQLDESAKERSVHKMVQPFSMNILHTHRSLPLLTYRCMPCPLQTLALPLRSLSVCAVPRGVKRSQNWRQK